MTSRPRRPGSRTHTWEIRDATGLLVAIHCRCDQADGDKQLWWELPDGTKGLGDLPLADLPLYRIDRLDAESVIVLCEGEKAADALWSHGIQAVGTVTGAASCPGRAALAELTGRQVVLWPDNDAPGRKHMRRVAAGLAEIVASVRLAEWPEAPDHGDAADFLAGGKTAEDVRALLEGAQAVPLPTPDPEEDAAAPAGGRRQPAELDRILELANEADLFHTPAGEPFADVRVDGHRETWPIPSRGLADWLGQRYWSAYQGAPRETALKDAVRSIAARARHGGPERQVFLRTGEADGSVYFDLADEQWRAVEITAEGWRVVAEPPVRFRRGSSALALPAPITGGSIEELRPFLNVADEAQWRLVVAWCVYATIPWGPYPPFILGGQQDSGKSTAAWVLRMLIDPDEAPLTTAPRDEEDLIVTAANVWCPVYDNLSRLDPQLSDMLCRLAEGAGLQRRARYTDTEVVTIKARRPVIITGIGDLATRGDLLDRALTLTLPALTDANRLAEAEFRGAFEAARPRILGALCALIVGVLRERPGVVLPRQPRMADFARVGVALERVGGWPDGSFLAAYEENRAAGHELALESYPIVEPLCRLANEHGDWEGSMSELLQELEQRASEEARRSRRWPKQPNGLSGQLDRVAPGLRARCVVVDHGRTNRGSWVRIRDSRNGLPESIVTIVTANPASVDRAHDSSESIVTGSSSGSDGSSPGDAQVTMVTMGDDRLDGGSSPPGSGPPRVDRAHDSSFDGPGDDGGDGSSLHFLEERGEREGEPVARTGVGWVRALLEAGTLDSHAPIPMTSGETILDVPAAARRWLAEAEGDGAAAAAARSHLERLAEALRASEAAP